MLLTEEPVTIWLAGGVPKRLLWRGQRFTVTDTPTPLYGYIADAPTHPLRPRIGWRFQGTGPTGETHVFDVHQAGRQEWELVAIYD